ncbi:MAG: hypothetical protein JKY02_11175 [Flavobacteriaceae bacterium]|nr:hypothetical protein [Flavobacteriaceae bacterium]
MKTICMTIAFLLISFSITAQKETTSHSLTQKIKIDGNLSEMIWQQHLAQGNFKQIKPNNGKEATQKTRIAITNDASYLYIAAEMSINPENDINTQLTSRDETGNSDYFSVILDPFGANREAWAFVVTAANVQSDIKITNNGNYDEWNAVWESAVKVSDDKWTVEIKIPFNSLRFPKGKFDNFHINFERFDAATNEDSFWNYINADINGFLNQFGKLINLKNVNPPINLSFLPFTSLVYEKIPEGETKTSFNGGLDVKYVYNNAYTLDVSTIPDFSQAPSDDQIFNLSPFEIKFDENRQFFVEGTEIFDKGDYLYTRKIGGEPININNVDLTTNEEIIKNPVSSNILNLVKFTGKSEKGLAIGVLNGITNKSEAIILNTDTNETRRFLTNPITNYNSIVLDQTLKNNSTITFINNSVIRSGDAYDANFTALLANFYDKKRTYRLSLKKAISQKYFSNAKNEFGHHYQVAIGKVSGTWRVSLSGDLQDELFDNNDFGFNARNNMFTYYANVSYVNTKSKKLFNSYRISLLNYNRYYYSLNRKEFSLNRISFFGSRSNNHNIFLEVSHVSKSKDFYEARVKDQHFNSPAFIETFFEYQTNRNKNLSFAGYVEYSKYLNSDLFSYEIETGFGLRYRMGEHLFFELESAYEFSPKDAGFLEFNNNDIIFGYRKVKELTNNLNINYSVNSKLNINTALRHYWIQVDYSDQFTLTDNGNLTTNNYAIDVDNRDANFNAFNIDFLAQWQFAPASELSVGYKLGARYFDRDISSNYGNNFSKTIREDMSHTLSVKLTYLIDFNSLRRNKKLKAI